MAGTFDQFISLALQARCADALRVARSIPTASLKPNQKTVVKQFLSRFTGRLASHRSRSPIGELISIYETYWHSALLSKDHGKYAERLLGKRVRRWLGQHRNVKISKASLEGTVVRLKRELEKMGFNCITGAVAPLQELEIWKKQSVVAHSILLPEGHQDVKTYLMSKFLTKGWMAYATMGLYYPGGWAKKEGLYCNTHAYDLKSERFHVSLLGHEAQHFADKKRFPKLGQIDLEYRAKLAEFFFARRTARRLFRTFASRAEYNEKSPHAYSNYCVLRDLSESIFGHNDFIRIANNHQCLSARILNRSAESLLKDHSQRLSRQGPRKVRRCIF